LKLYLRPVAFDDCLKIFKWRNNPFLLSFSSSQKTVEWEEHTRWFKNSIDSDKTIIYIINYDGKDIGQVRFDKQNEQIWVISVYVIQEFTGQGIGVHAIKIGCKKIFKKFENCEIISCVRNDNLRAHYAFIKAGFIEKQIKGFCPEKHFKFSKSSKIKKHNYDCFN